MLVYPGVQRRDGRKGIHTYPGRRSAHWESQLLVGRPPYAPLAGPLARGVVIVQFRTEHFRVMPVFGKAAVELSPRVGHLHVTVDDTPGTWAHTGADPIIVVGLTPGPHQLRLELADPNHQTVATEIVAVTVPHLKAPASQRH